MEHKGNWPSITKSLEKSAGDVGKNLQGLPSLKLSDSNVGSPANLPTFDKFRKWMLYGLSGLIIGVATLLILVSLIKRIF